MANRIFLSLLLLALGNSSVSAQEFWTETFSDQATATANWTSGGTNNGSLTWAWTDQLNAGSWQPGNFGSPSGSTGYMWFNSDGNGDFAHDITLTGDGNPADCSGRSDVRLRFYTLYRIFNEAADGQVGISTDGMNFSYYSIPEFQGLDGSSAATDRYEGWIDLAIPEADGQAQVWVQFRWIGKYEYYWKVDDLEMYEADEAMDLSISKIANPDPVTAGTSLTYTLNVNNASSSDAQDVSLSDTLPGGTAFLSLDAPVGWSCTTPSVGGAGTIACSIATLAPGDSGDFTLAVDVDPSLADGSELSNTAAITSAIDPNASNDSATATTSVVREVNFNLSLDCAPDTVIAGSGAGNLSCTLDLAQTGPSDASGVAVGLTLPAGVTVDSADTSGAPGSSFSLPTWTIGDAAVNYSGTLLLTMTVDGTASGDLTIGAEVSASETIANGPVGASDVVGAEAAADAPTAFMTTIAFTNGYDGTAGVTISCNNGLPLEQSKDISAAGGVNFIVTSLDFVAADTECEIAIDVASGYTASVLANGVDTGSSCLFSAAPAAGEAPFDGSAARMNSCAITAAPLQSQFVVTKDWVTFDDGNTGQTGTIHIWCAPAAEDSGSNFGTVETTANVDGNGTFYLDFYPSPAGATCHAEEDVDSSAVESSSTCDGGVAFAVGDTVKTCAITNTVFFEGIPTLSRYGVAILALLMLGMGFIAVRRFA